MKSIDENFFKILNKSLLSTQKVKLFSTKKKYDTFFIVAPPRGSSMFFQQILISFTKIGYVSNLIASLWNYPEIAVILQKRFLNHNNFTSNFRSNFGITDGIFEPHEWGYFWRKWLDIQNRECFYNPKSMINWKNLNAELDKIKGIFELPIIFDTGYVNTYFDEINKFIKSSKYIFIFRSPYAVCNSIFKAKIKQHKNINSYWSAKPKDFKSIEKINNPIEQVVAQVYEITKAMLESRSKLSKKKYITLKYEDLFKSSDKIIKEMIKFTTNDFSIYKQKKRNFMDRPVESFSTNFKTKNKIEFFDEKFKKEFDFYYNKYFKDLEYNKI
jgi:hypothetical protein